MDNDALKQEELKQIIRDEVKQALGDILQPKFLKEFPQKTLPLLSSDIFPISSGVGTNLDSYKVALSDISEYIVSQFASPDVDTRVILSNLTGTILTQFQWTQLNAEVIALNKYFEWQYDESGDTIFTPFGVPGTSNTYRITFIGQIYLTDYTPGDHLFLTCSLRTNPLVYLASHVTTFPAIITGGRHTVQMSLIFTGEVGTDYCFGLISQAETAEISDYGPYTSYCIVESLWINH